MKEMLKYIIHFLTLFQFVCVHALTSIPLTEQWIIEENYPYEKHTIQTTDGYVLTNYRVLPTVKREEKLPPVVLMHGMMSSSEDFVLMGNDSIVFTLADAGYDVWLPNARPSESAVHVNISREDEAYWNFSFDEIGKYDLAESIDHVLETTGAEKVIFIGVSLGNLKYIIMLNERQDLINKIAISVALSPAYFNNFFRPLAVIFQLLIQLGLYRHLVLGGKNHSVQNNNWQSLKASISTRSEFELTYAFWFLFYGTDWDQIDWKHAAKVVSRGTIYSLNQMSHYTQISKQGVLEKFDFGHDGNMKKYGTPTPPPYSWKVLKAPMVLYCGKNDRPLSQDLSKTMKLLRTSSAKVYVRVSNWKYFNHMDYIASRTVAKELYADLMNVLNRMLRRKD